MPPAQPLTHIAWFVPHDLTFPMEPPPYDPGIFEHMGLWYAAIEDDKLAWLAWLDY